MKKQNMGFIVGNTFSGWCFTANIVGVEGGEFGWHGYEMSFGSAFWKCQSSIFTAILRHITGKCLYLTLVYGANEDEERVALWDTLRR